MTRDLFLLKMQIWQADLADVQKEDWVTDTIRDDLRSLWMELEAIKEDFTK